MPGAGGMYRDVLGEDVTVEALGDAAAGIACGEVLRVDDDAVGWRSWVVLAALLLVLCVA